MTEDAMRRNTDDASGSSASVFAVFAAPRPFPQPPAGADSL